MAALFYCRCVVSSAAHEPVRFNSIWEFKDFAASKGIHFHSGATTLEAFAWLTGAAGPGGGPKGGGPKGGGFKGGGEIQRTLDDLPITGKTRDNADRLLRAHQGKLRRLEELSRAELAMQMRDVLNEEDYRTFKAALDRAPGGQRFGGPKTPDLNRRIDELQKELEDLRGKLAK
jgi:hypothetical protein